MRFKRARIDSLNLASKDIESLFSNAEFRIEPVKDRGVFKPERWHNEFGKKTTRNIVEAKILHTHMGLTIPLKRYAVNRQMQTIEFAGLHGYNERSEYLIALLKDKLQELQPLRLMRVDVAIDYKGKVPKKIINKIAERRKPFKYMGTTYYKTPREKKTNLRMDIKVYDKSKKEKLEYPLERLEFVFKSDFFKGLYVKDLDTAIIKMQKTIELMTGIKVKILLFDL